LFLGDLFNSGRIFRLSGRGWYNPHNVLDK